MRKNSVHMSFILAITLFLSVFLFHSPVYAAGLEVEIGSVQGTMGEMVTVPVSFRNVPATGINRCDFVISYDTNVLQAVEDGVTAGPVTKNAAVTFDSITDENSGTIKFLYSDETGLGNEAITTDGVFANIEFLVKQNTATSSKIKIIGETAFGNTSSEYITAVVIDGSVEVIEKHGYKVSGYIAPDLNFSSSSSAVLKSGFKVGVVCSEISALTDQNGYFELYITNCMPAECTLTIAKDGFLCREINNVCFSNFSGHTEVSLAEDPIKMCAGDINNDGAINILDIMMVSKAFNASKNDSRYSSESDVNKDDVVNMADIMAVAQHFNKVTGDYK